VEINLLDLLHQTLLIDNAAVRTNVLDTLYVLMNRSVLRGRDDPFAQMRRQAFAEESLQGYNSVLDTVFAQMTGPNGVDREGYGVGKKFVMVPHPLDLLTEVHLCACDGGIITISLQGCFHYRFILRYVGPVL
jgi:hypothetical protein